VRSSRSLLVLKTRLAPALISDRIAANSGPRWSIIGRLMARTTRSGSGVGPGMRSWLWKVISLVKLGRVRKQRDRACALQRGGKRALVLGACARHAPRQD